VRPPHEVHFLGFRFHCRRSGEGWETAVLMSAKAERRLRTTVREIRPRAAPVVRCVKFTPDYHRGLRRAGPDSSPAVPVTGWRPSFGVPRHLGIPQDLGDPLDQLHGIRSRPADASVPGNPTNRDRLRGWAYRILTSTISVEIIGEHGPMLRT
jgi:hypothetical protein